MRFADCARGTFTVTDGAWGTELLQLGAQPAECIDAWNLTNPGLVRKVAESYVEAGSRVILTNTFRANPASLAQYQLLEKCGDINRAGVRISREAAGGRALVFASIGPSGAKLAAGDVTPAQLHSAFSHQAHALASEGPDALLIETMIDLEEARIAARAALATGLPVIVSFVFGSGQGRNRTLTGATAEDVAAAMAHEGVHGIGTNCGTGIRETIAVCRRLAHACELPIWVKPNAGLPELFDGALKYGITPHEFAQAAQRFREAGATFLGGCCGTTPDFIRALVRSLRP